MRQDIFEPAVSTEDGKTTYSVSWRTPYPPRKKLNPIWCFRNEWDPNPPDWSLPRSPMWLRRVNWWFRNPFHNYGRYVLGVGDRNYKVVFHHRPARDEAHQPIGIERASLVFSNNKTLPWFHYGSKRFNFYWGWQPTGFAGLKLNKWSILAAPLAPFMFIALIIRRWF